ncbi:glycosyltransferase family 9 protein [Phenylobacterium sp.]|uniref:glycosyltransferase family 9 protein n=1 Tax=Phenylobacterium sp. TaxID=1871053 RepID=UPI003918CA76
MESVRDDLAALGARYQRGQALLAAGRYAEGWPLFEGRERLAPGLIPPGPRSYPEWRGEPLGGRSILVWVEQGFGDQIMLARFAQVLKERGAGKVTLACRPQTVALLATAPGVDEALSIPVNASVAVDRHDLWTRYFSLPLHVGATLENLPTAPYLAAPADRLERWQDYRGVGFVWRSSPTGVNAARKTIPDDLADRILDLGAISLHPEDTGAGDFADTAAIISRLDAVVAVDTAVAHLAGAMGKPTFILLAEPADWRWLTGREDSPWYPTARLVRQSRAGDWSSAVERVAAELR